VRHIEAWKKYEEAYFFVQKMGEARDTPLQFSYFTSAFFSAALSVFDYLDADARGDAALKRWWDAHGDNKKNQKKPGVGNEALKYFKMWRNYEVHAANRPDKPVPDPVQQETQVLIINEPLEGRSVHESIRYTYTDFPGGSEDVLPACTKYLILLENLLDTAEEGTSTPPSA